MKQMIIPVDDKTLCIYTAKDSTILDCQIEHLKRVRKWLSQTPFATLATALKSGTEKDQLRCMHQAERWLLKCLRQRYSVGTHEFNSLKMRKG